MLIQRPGLIIKKFPVQILFTLLFIVVIGSSGVFAAKNTSYSADRTPPSAPANLQAGLSSGPNQANITISWQKSTDNVEVVKYRLFIKDTNTKQTRTVDVEGYKNSYSYSAPYSETTFKYQVVALDAAGNTSNTSNIASLLVSKAVPPDTQPPSVPANFSAVYHESAERYGVRLSWSASTDANSGVSYYHINRVPSDGSQPQDFTVSAKQTTYDDLMFKMLTGANVDFTYKIKAVDAAGNASPYSSPIIYYSPPTKGGYDPDENLAAPETVDRSAADRTDESGQPMIHTMYVLPSDGADRHLDTNGQISSSVESFSNWFNQASGGLSLRIDKFSGKPDISYYRLPNTAAHYSSFGNSMAAAVASDLKSAGLFKSNKIYSIYYEGGNGTSCGGASWPPELPGQYAVMFIKNKPGSSLNCETSNIGSGMNYWEFAMLHDIIHAMGFVQPCAPNYNPSKPAHVVDDPRDLMYTGPEYWNPSIIDVGNNDYFKHNNACADLEDSPYLIRPYVPAILEAPNCLYPGQSLRSPNGRYSLKFQATDRNLVIYSPYRALWQNHTYNKGGAIVCMQGDGILAQYNSSWQPVWYTPTHNSGGRYLAMQDDGNLVIYNAYWQPVWASWTNGQE